MNGGPGSQCCRGVEPRGSWGLGEAVGGSWDPEPAVSQPLQPWPPAQAPSLWSSAKPLAPTVTAVLTSRVTEVSGGWSRATVPVTHREQQGWAGASTECQEKPPEGTVCFFPLVLGTELGALWGQGMHGDQELLSKL